MPRFVKAYAHSPISRAPFAIGKRSATRTYRTLRIRANRAATRRGHLSNVNRPTLSPSRLLHAQPPGRRNQSLLLQHADNPVDWYPGAPKLWPASASENKPIFLSIGYSACHWCHVMEHESFEDPAIAR